jgi:hypothetical protein
MAVEFCPDGQATPQPPQLAVLLKSTQLPPQSENPGVVQPQMPAVHTSPAEQL